MDGIDVILGSTWTPVTLLLALICLIIVSLVRGWIQPRSTVEQILEVQNLRITEAIKRGDDYKAAWELSEKRGDILQDMVDQFAPVTATLDKVLSSLPAPRSGDTEELRT